MTKKKLTYNIHPKNSTSVKRSSPIHVAIFKSQKEKEEYKKKYNKKMSYSCYFKFLKRQIKRNNLLFF